MTMPTHFFGDPWDAPVTDDGIRVPTPVGVDCSWCLVPIADGDQGQMVGCVRTGPDGEPYGTVEPWHKECLMRSVVGSPEHLDGECYCHTGKVDDTPQTPQERRAEAIEVWRRIRGTSPAS